MMVRSFAAVAVGVVASPAVAGVVASEFAGGDAEFLALTDNGALEQAVVESRIGNGAGNGAWELGLWRLGAVGTPLDQAQRTVSPSNAAQWTMTYDGATTLSFSIEGVTVSSAQIGGPFSDILVRVRAAEDSTSFVGRIQLDGGDFLGDVTADEAGEVNYLRISNMGEAFGAFTLTGVQQLTWSGDRPNNSALAAQFKLTNVIPAPGSVAALAGLGLLAAHRRRSTQASV